MKKIFMGFVRGYQKFISPLFPPTCRYHPTCSQYTFEALEKHGALKGSVMGAARIIRCNPFVEGGIDPVPNHFTLKRQYPRRNKTAEGDGDKYESIHYLLDVYNDDIVLQSQDFDELLDQIVDLTPLSLTLLSESFLNQVNEQVEAYGVVKPSYKLYEINTIYEQEHTMTPPFHSSINHAADDHHTSFLLIEEQCGVIKTSDIDLGVQLVLTHGVTEEDIETKSPRLIHYLTVLDRMEV